MTAITGKLSEFAPRAKFIHIDIDPAEISKNVPAHIPIVGDAANILPRLTAEYRALARRPERLEEWWSRIRVWQERHPLALRGLDRRRDQAAVHGPGAATRRPAATRSSPATSASTRCGPRSTTTSPQPRRWINSGRPGDDGLRPAGGDGREGRLPRSDGRLHRGRRLGPDERAGARDLRPGGDRDQGVHHEQRLPRAWSGSGRSCSGTSATARSTWVSGRTSSSSPRPTARPASGSPTRHTLVDDMKEALATEGPVLVDVRVTREENTYPMIPAGQAGAGHGGLSPWASLEPRSSCRSTSSRRRPACAPAASTSCRSWSRTSRVS